MGLWGDMGGFCADHWGDIVVGAASTAGFALGGMVGAPLIGAAVFGGLAGAATAEVKGENVTEGFAFGFGGGFLGGAVGRWGFKSVLGLAKGAVKDEVAGAAKAMFGRELGRSSLSLGTLGGAVRLRGMAGAALGPGTLSSFVDDLTGSYNRELRTYGEVPVIEVIADKSPPGMPIVKMPDPNRLPDGLTLSPAVRANYDPPLAKMLGDSWKCFGADKSDAQLSTAWTNRDFPNVGTAAAASANIGGYQQWVEALDKAHVSLLEQQRAVVAVVAAAADISAAGQQKIGALINIIAELAKVNPADMSRKSKLAQLLDQGMLVTEHLHLERDGTASEDSYVMSLIDTAVGNTETVMRDFAERLKEAAAAVPADPVGVRPPPLAGDPGGLEPVPAVDRPSTPAAGDTETADEWRAAPAAWNWDSPSDKTNRNMVESADKPVPGRNALAGLDTTAPNPSAASPGLTSPPVPMGSTLDGGLPPLGAPRSVPSGIDPRDYPRNHDARIQPVASAPTPINAPAAPNPALPPNPALTPSGDAAAPSMASHSGVTAPPTGMAQPGRPVGNNGKVSYPIPPPDGPSQELPPVVAQALDAAFANKASTDARAAYAEAAAQWSDSDLIRAVIDPNQLGTGDIAMWSQNRTAMVVVVGNGVFQVIVDGELRPFAAEMNGMQGPFGSFAGFARPPGMGIGAPADSPVAIAV